MRRSFNRFKSDGRGWHNENYEHQQAAKFGSAGKRVGMWSSEAAPDMFIEKSFPWIKGNNGATPKSAENAGKALDSSTKEAPSRFLNKFYPYLPENVRGKVKNREALKGGLADNVPDEQFDQEQLQRGTADEMQEHTNNPQIAKEIAKDHIMKNPEEYREGEYQ